MRNTQVALITLLLLFSFNTLQAQVRKISTTSTKEVKKQGVNKSTRLVLSTPTNNPSSKRRTSNEEVVDYALYRNLIRKYTWYEGLGAPISKETAKHLPFYYKLSMKNDQGHWQHIEAMHQDTLTNKHDQSTYVLDKRFDDDENSKEWIEKLNTVTQWFITSDLSGKEVVEERAYNKDGDLVYSFIPVKNTDGRVTGSYNDAWGYPVDMREDENNTYGSVVRITYDHCGRDSIIDFLDGEGLRKYNSNGVDQQRFQYDDKDRTVLVTSHNMVGDYTNDNWGNCGNRYQYSDTDGQYSVIRVNKNMVPMKMPAIRADGTRTFLRCDIKQDRWGRDVEAVMLDAEGHPDATSTGVHKIIYHYDDKGIVLSTTYQDIHGNALSEEHVH